ncbi:protein translocase subunit SecF [Alicyclobacillus curvatus]|jgi:preprotein translocase subunit SecF|nr:protein translocase subunit SecF [Alicyclobacillus curvatus]
MRQWFDIIKYRRWFFLLSGTITVLGILAFAFFGFNLGTDFKAGSRVQMDLGQPVTISQVEQMFTQNGFPIGQNAVTLGSSTAGSPNNTAVVRFGSRLTPAQVATIDQLEKKYFPKSQGNTTQMVDPIVATQTSHKAVYAVLLASLFIVIYVSIRFEYRFAIAAIIALLHDAFIVMSVFALLRREVDLTFVAAILTIVGYSINDTIVIFDRIRENQRIAKPRTFDELERLVNKSLWQTMTRSINTVLTVLIAALLLYFFGGQSIRTFTFALIIGLVSGAYSSIFIASPIWVVWKAREFKKKPKNSVTEIV